MAAEFYRSSEKEENMLKTPGKIPGKRGRTDHVQQCTALGPLDSFSTGLTYLAGQAYTVDMYKSKNPHAVALGKMGARKGGLARAAVLTSKERIAIARKAAEMRWKKEPKREESDVE